MEYKPEKDWIVITTELESRIFDRGIGDTFYRGMFIDNIVKCDDHIAAIIGKRPPHSKTILERIEYRRAIENEINATNEIANNLASLLGDQLLADLNEKLLQGDD